MESSELVNLILEKLNSEEAFSSDEEEFNSDNDDYMDNDNHINHENNSSSMVMVMIHLLG